MIPNLDIELTFQGDDERAITPVRFRELAPLVEALANYGKAVCDVMEWHPRAGLDLALVANPKPGSTILNFLPSLGDALEIGSQALSMIADAYVVIFGSRGVYEILRDARAKRQEPPEAKPVYQGPAHDPGNLTREVAEAIAMFAAGRAEVQSRHYDLEVAVSETTHKKITIKVFDQEPITLIQREHQIKLSEAEQFQKAQLYNGNPAPVQFTNPRGHYLARFNGENFNALRVTLTTGEEGLVIYRGPGRPATNRLQRIRSLELVQPMSHPPWDDDVRIAFIARPADHD